MTTALAEDEILTEVRLPIISDQTRFGFYEFNRRAGDFAIAMALVTYRLADGVIAEPRVGIGGAEARPRRIPEAEAALNGRPPERRDVPGGGRGGRRRPSIRSRISRRMRNIRRDLVRAVTRRALEQSGRMSAPTKGSGMTWVGRSIRRLEDPALVAGQGRFTADLPAAHWVRFVRSPVASGRIERIDVPPDANVITAADLAARQADPADAAQVQLRAGGAADPGRRTWCALSAKPVAAVVAPSKEEAEDIADRVEVEIDAAAAVVDARRALAAGAPSVHRRGAGQRHRRRAGQDAGFRCNAGAAHTRIQGRGALAPAERHAAGGRAPGTRPTMPRPAASR